MDILEQRYPKGGAVPLRGSRGEDEITVFGDFLVHFKEKGLSSADIDVCLIRGLRDPERRRKSLRQAEEGGEILLAIEIVSPDYAFKDYEHNPSLYEKAGIGEYLIIDLLGDYLAGPYKLSGFRMHPTTKTYQPIVLDKLGRLYSSVAGLLIGVDPEVGGLVVTDAVTGERVLPPKEKAALEAEARQAEAEARQAAEQHAARLEVELARLEETVRSKP